MGRGRPALPPEERRCAFDLYLTPQEFDLCVGALPRYLTRSHGVMLIDANSIFRLALETVRQQLQDGVSLTPVHLQPRTDDGARSKERRIWVTAADRTAATDLRQRFRLGTLNRGYVATLVILTDVVMERLTQQAGPNSVTGLRGTLRPVLAAGDPRLVYQPVPDLSGRTGIDPWDSPAARRQPSRRFTI